MEGYIELYSIFHRGSYFCEVTGSITEDVALYLIQSCPGLPANQQTQMLDFFPGDSCTNFPCPTLPIYDIASSLQTIAATYQDDFPVATTTSVTFDSAGLISGVYNGCVMTGSAGLIDPNYNLYDIELSLASCSTAPPTLGTMNFSGFAMRTDALLGDGLKIIALNESPSIFTLPLVNLELAVVP